MCRAVDRAGTPGALAGDAHREPDRLADGARGGDRDPHRRHDATGRILALEARIEADFGAYCFFPANYMARVIAMILPGPYSIDAYAYSVDAYLTNKCPASPMRAPMSSTSWIMEGTIDAIARELISTRSRCAASTRSRTRICRLRR